MARYKVILAYDGSDFKGYQRQGDARTVQGVFETALRLIGWQGRTILSSGRTDTGVHATGQVVAFDFVWKHTAPELLRALNANLPKDVAVRDLEEAPADFHPRYAAQARRYCYRLFCDEIRDPMHERYAWRVWPAVFLQNLKAIAELSVGTHDFGAFGRPQKPGGKTIRTVTRADWLEESGDLIFEIVGNSFLYHMVRRLTAFQVSMAQNRTSLDEARRYFTEGEKLPYIGLAPAQGLTLVRVYYP
jgi:tRNA pseudouridine38-40 synthase